MNYVIFMFALPWFFVSYKLWIPKFGEKIDRILSIIGMIANFFLMIMAFLC